MSRSATASRARSVWSAWIRSASRVVTAVTFGFPSRSPPIQLPQRSFGIWCGGREPLSPSLGSSCRSASSIPRRSRGARRKIVPSKWTIADRTSSSGVTRRVRMLPVRQRLVNSSRSRRTQRAASAGSTAVERRSNRMRILPRRATSVRRRASVGCAVSTGLNVSPATSERILSGEAPAASAPRTALLNECV